MLKISNKMPVTVILLLFSFLIVVCGLGAAGFLMAFGFRDINSLIYGFLILAGSVLLATLLRMFANIGQMIFDMRLDLQRLFSQSRESEQNLNQDLRNQLQLQTDNLIQLLQAITQKLDEYSSQARESEQSLNQDLRDQLKLQADTLNQNLIAQTGNLSQGLQSIIKKLDEYSSQARESEQSLNQDLRDQLKLQADTLNQNLIAQAGSLTQSLQAITQELGRSSQEAKELGQKFTSVKDNFDQMNCDSKDMNQNLQQIRDFFEQIEKHLDLKK